MKGTVTIKFITRTKTSKGSNNKLKKEGYVLGNIYGKETETLSIAVKKDELRKSLNKFGKNSIYNLEGEDGKLHTAMIKTIQVSPLSYDYLHVDFHQVNLSDEIKADTLIKITGLELLESKRLYLNRQIDTILVSGHPQNIPDDITIDVSKLNSGDVIKIGDIKFPEGIHSELSEDQVILSANEAKMEELPEEENQEELTGN